MSESDHVAEIKDLKSFPARVKNLQTTFEEKFKKKCQMITSAPGRINLIGEHIDYMGYGVLPAAIKQSTLCAVSYTKNKKKTFSISIHNDSKLFESKAFEFRTCEDIITLDLTKKHHWTNYVLCGIKGIIIEKKKVNKNYTLPHFEVILFISGNVPIGKGLSSSSSINCSCMLVYVKMFSLQLNKTQIAQLAITSERYIGMAGGGMDQTISIFAEKGFAKFIEFVPCLKITKRVEICSGYQFVVSDSMVEQNKSESASMYYNVRVVECRLAAAIIGKVNKVKGWKSVRTLRDLQMDMNIANIDEMIGITKRALQKEVMSLKQVAKALGIMLMSTLRKRYLMNNENMIKLKNEKELKLRSRALHVFSEARRVHDFMKFSKDPKKIGELLNESHFSCRLNYEASCTELEELTILCRKNGALGSRFTGAGWGGCCISLVKDEEVDKFLETIWKEYYEKKKVAKKDMNSVLFKTQAENGALIYLCGVK